MSDQEFMALRVTEDRDGFHRVVARRRVADLPPGDVTIRVAYSSLNYKDALSATGNKGVTRRYPHTPGVDAAGIVETSSTNAFRPGDAVIVTGYDLGMNTSGGFGQYIRVPADWVVPLPAGLSPREAMAYGTAGFTAALSVIRLRHQEVVPGRGPILVTGATGGVGSLAVALLAVNGYEVVAATGQPDARDYLRSLGAADVIGRDEVDDRSGKPMLSARWAGAIDTVGGNILTTAVKSTQAHGAVACCGNVAAAEFNCSVYPFILRGVSLLGVDSASTPMTVRKEVWSRLAGEWKLPQLDAIVVERTLTELPDEIERMLGQPHRGRVVVNLDTDAV